MPRLADKLLLIGWDAADWDVLRPLLAAGQMPTLQRLIARGTSGTLATLDPPFSPLLWTSIATGKTADKHGVLGFSQPREDGLGVRPVLGTTRRAKAFWNIAHQSGLRSNVIGWWPSHPAEPIHGVAVSNFFHRVRGPVWAPEPSPPRSVHPPALAPVLDALRVHPDEITPALVAPFAPTFLHEPPATDAEQRGVDTIARLLAEASSVHAAATWALEETEWDVAAVYLDSIDHFSHAFMAYHPPQQPHIEEEPFRRFRDVVAGAYRFHDMMLARLLALAGPETTVVLVSDHGFESGGRRLAGLPHEPAGPAAEHRDVGVFVAAGPAIRRGEPVFGASLLDVTPTLLTLLGLAVGADMDGRVLTPIFAEPPVVRRIPSWEDVPGDAGRHPDGHSDPWADQAALDQLVALGYIDPPGEDAAAAAATSLREAAYALARVYLSTDRPEQAIPLAEQAWSETQAEHYGLTLLLAYEAAGQIDRGLALADEIETRRAETTAADLTAGAVLPHLDLIRGRLLLAQGDAEAALRWLNRAASAEGGSATVLQSLAAAFVQLGRLVPAEDLLRRALGLDPERPATLRLLAHVLTETDRPDDARDLLLQSLSLRFFDPAGHYALGRALRATGDPEAAAQALQLALAQRPTLSSARFLLAQVLRDHLERPVEASRVLAGAPPDVESRSVPQRPEDRVGHTPAV